MEEIKLLDSFKKLLKLLKENDLSLDDLFKNSFYNILWNQNIGIDNYKKSRDNFNQLTTGMNIGSFTISKDSFNNMITNNVGIKKYKHLIIYIADYKFFDDNKNNELGLILRFTNFKYQNEVNNRVPANIESIYKIDKNELVEITNSIDFNALKKYSYTNYNSIIPNSDSLLYKTLSVRYITKKILKNIKKATADIRIELILFKCNKDGSPTDYDYIDENDNRISICTLYNDSTKSLGYYDAGQLEP